MYCTGYFPNFETEYTVCSCTTDCYVFLFLFLVFRLVVLLSVDFLPRPFRWPRFLLFFLWRLFELLRLGVSLALLIQLASAKELWSFEQSRWRFPVSHRKEQFLVNAWRHFNSVIVVFSVFSAYSNTEITNLVSNSLLLLVFFTFNLPDFLRTHFGLTRTPNEVPRSVTLQKDCLRSPSIVSLYFDAVKSRFERILWAASRKAICKANRTCMLLTTFSCKRQINFSREEFKSKYGLRIQRQSRNTVARKTLFWFLLN